MLKLTDDGYKYVSKNGITYDIFEGMSVGIYPKKTSDILFIMLHNADYNVDNHVVGYLFGAMLIPEREKEYEESIRQLVDEYEERNGLGE